MTERKEDQHPAEEAELEKLVKEKLRLSRKLQLLDGDGPVEGYKEAKEYERIKEIDVQLWDLV